MQDLKIDNLAGNAVASHLEIVIEVSLECSRCTCDYRGMVGQFGIGLVSLKSLDCLSNYILLH